MPPPVIGSAAATGAQAPPLNVEWPWSIEHAESEAWHRTASQAQAAPVRAKGYYLNKSKLYRAAKEAVDKALNYAFVGRRNKRARFRQLWIVRINAAARENGFTYRELMQGLKLASIALDRKHLADLAVNDAPAFTKIVEQARAAIASTRRRSRANRIPEHVC